MRIPTQAKLTEAFGEEIGAALYTVLKGRVAPNIYPAVATWISQCYHRPSVSELKMAACDAILNGFGLEGITPDGAMYPVAEYVNTGDTYETTLLRELDSNRVLITSWGDYVEQNGL